LVHRLSGLDALDAQGREVIFVPGVWASRVVNYLSFGAVLLDLMNRPRFYAHFRCWEGWPDVDQVRREHQARAVRLVREHRDDYDSEWAAMKAISGRLGMSAETLRKWVRQAGRC
jgi:hypothetical protein